VTTDFFISYNRADSTWAEWIAWVLEEHGYRVIIQAWDFRPGGNFILDMQWATDEAERTVIVLSDAYLNALYTQPEWAAAFGQDRTSTTRTLLPIRVAPCKATGMLAALVYVDLVDKTETEAEALLLEALKDRAKPSIRPSFPRAVPNAERATPERVGFPGKPMQRVDGGTGTQINAPTDSASQNQAPLSEEDRLWLIKTVSALTVPQFDQLVFVLNPPDGIVPPNPAALGNRSVELLSWAKGPTGPGLSRFLDLFTEVTGLSLPVRNASSPLIERFQKLSENDWSTLFAHFSVQDTASVKRAFLHAFKSVYGDFQTIWPGYPPLKELTQIQRLLAEYDSPELGVMFVTQVLAGLRCVDENSTRNFTSLEGWRDRIAQTHHVQISALETLTGTNRPGYLLVALKESGRITGGVPWVNLFTELQVPGEPGPIECNVASVTCPLNEVAGHLSNFIRSAETALIPYECDQITLELFLPCVHVEEDVALWEVQNEQNRPRPLGKHRGFVVRSLERINSPKRQMLGRNWSRLKDCVATDNASADFHLQEHCPAPGDLEALLVNKTGVKLVANLPTDREERKDILYDIINSAVPIALWSRDDGDCTATERLTEIDTLLGECCLTDFSTLAHQWRLRRIQAGNTAITHLRLLCDCPDRVPNLPNPNQDTDLLFVS